MILELFKLVLKNTLLTSIYIIILIIIKTTLLNKYSAKFNYYIWLIILFKLIFPFNIPIYLKVKSKIGNYYVSNQYFELGDIDNRFIIVCAAIWILVAISILIYNIYLYNKFKDNLYNTSTAIVESNIINIFNSQYKDLNINKNIELRFNKNVNSPLGIGFFKRYIYFPKINISEEQLIFILKHELIHFKRNDLLYKRLILFIKCIYWFNPLIYKLDKIISLDCEISCDELVLQNYNLDDKKKYALTLIDSLKSKDKIKNEVILSTSFNKIDIRKRVEIILEAKPKKRGTILSLFVAIIATTSIFSLKSYESDKVDDIISEPIVENIKDEHNATILIDTKTGDVFEVN